MSADELTPAFRTYADKPTALLTGYTTVRGAELREIDTMLDEQGGNVPVSGFETRFGRPEQSESEGDSLNTDHVDECLRFLQAVDFVEVTPQDVVTPFNGGAFADLSFEARLLYHVRQQSGRRRHLTYVSEVLTGLDERRVSLERLIEEVQADDRESYDLSWNEEKIRMWANLFDPLGAVSYYNDGDIREILASPTRSLLSELIAYHADHASDESSIVDLFEWIDETFLPVFAKRSGEPRLSIAVADTLRTMSEDGCLTMYRESDSQTVVRLPQAGGSDRTISKLDFDSPADTAAYRYPLDRTTRRAH